MGSLATPSMKKSSKSWLLKAHQQEEVVTLLADLLKNSFTLQESLKFMKQLLVKERPALAHIEKQLSQGELLDQCFKEIGFSDVYVSQLYLAEVHGDLVGTLQHINQQLRDRHKQRQQVIKALGYPGLLLVFLMVAIMLMKWVLLPQLSQIQGEQPATSLSLLFIEHSPLVVLLSVLFGSGLFLALKLYFRKKSAVSQANFLMCLPVIKLFYRFHYTSFFACEWGKLINQGLEMKQIILVMQHQENTKLMREIASLLDQQLAQGQPVHRQIKKWCFFQKELSVIIQQGEAKGKLGDELIIYSERLWEQLNMKVGRLLMWLQPLIFLFVAILIVGVYGAMLLPIYKGMEGIL